MVTVDYFWHWRKDEICINFRDSNFIIKYATYTVSDNILEFTMHYNKKTYHLTIEYLKSIGIYQPSIKKIWE